MIIVDTKIYSATSAMNEIDRHGELRGASVGMVGILFRYRVSSLSDLRLEL
jgi:hypothetical protein